MNEQYLEFADPKTGRLWLNKNDDEHFVLTPGEQLPPTGYTRVIGLSVKHHDIAAEIRKHIDFTTKYWEELIECYGPNSVITHGIHYVIGEEPEPNERRDWLGHGGHKFTIKFKDGREVVSHNLWYQGPIPTRFRDRLQDNAELAK